MADKKKSKQALEIEKLKAKQAEHVAKLKEKANEKRTNLRNKNLKEKQRGNRGKLLVSIVNQKDAAQLKEVLDESSVSLSIAFAGVGTARSQVLDYLGIGETEKAVVFSLFPESDEEIILREIQTRMSLYLVGRGISFTIPLTGISEIIANGLAGAATEKTVDGRKIMKQEERKYDLIVAVVNADYADMAMEAARSAGAAGGTLIRARTLDNAKAEQFIGISLVAEQEILLILSKREGKLAIMQALTEQAGLKTEAGGVIFSLPVDHTAGIGAAGETDEKASQSQSSDKSAKDPKKKEPSQEHKQDEAESARE